MMGGRWIAVVFTLSCLVRTGCGTQGSLALTSPLQDEGQASPESAAEIVRVTPGQAHAGSEVTLEIDGHNFARGVYISFSHPAVRVLTTRRVSGKRLEARVAIGSTAPLGAFRLYVSNSAGPVAESQFVILGGIEPRTTPAAPLEPTPGRPSALAPAHPAPLSTPPRAAAQAAPPEGGTPEVTSVEPRRASPGSEVRLKIAGKNFAQGATVAFSNPGILVEETKVLSETEVRVSMKVAEDALTGPTGLFVVNPDDTETEFPFEVVRESSEPSATTEAETAAAGESVRESLRFDVLNLGEGIDIFQNVDKPRGTLIVERGRVKYEEAGEEVFSVAPGDIKEVDVNTILGVNTGTFHVTLESGKTFNFVPASLRTSDTPSIIEALLAALE